MIININKECIEMAIAKLSPSKVAQPTPKKIDVLQPTDVIKKNTIVNDLPDTTTPWVETTSASRSVDRYVATDGYPWSGTYYQRLRMAGDYSSSVDILLDNTYQQYSRINNYIMMLDNPLAPTVDNKTKITTASFEAVISDTIIPNRGDAWVADLGDARLGIFAATDTERLSIFTTTTYKCTFVLQKIITNDDHGLLDNLNDKVVTDYHFNKHYLELGQSPVLTTQELALYRDRKDKAEHLARKYYADYYSRRLDSLCLQTDDKTIYDSAVTKFVNATTPVSNQYCRPYEPTAVISTVYDMITGRKNNNYKDTLVTDMMYMDAITGMDIAYCYGLNHTPVTHIATSKAEPIYYGWGHSEEPTTYTLAQLTSNEPEQPTPLLEVPSGATELIAVPLRLFPDVVNNKTYILSEEWYTLNQSTSLLETMIDDWTKSEPIDPHKLAQIILGIKHLSKVDAFYLIPIIVFLLTYSN